MEHCPFAFNNFIYKIVLSQPLTPSTFGSKSQRPGTIAPTADGISTIVIRLSNPHAEGLNNANRVENELAAQVLLRQHLITSHPDLAYLIPAVYAWQPCRYPDVSDESGFAWTMCEYKPGADLDAEFNKMELSEKLEVVGQVAIIFTALKKTPLPEPLKVHLGGLTFNDEGEVVGGQMPLLPTGPWQTYEDLWVSRLNQQLHEADKSSALQGWRRDGLRERIDQFIVAPNIASLLDGVDTMQRALIHNDMSTLL